jgi:hypothetical protein
VISDYVPATWIERLRTAMAETMELSRSVTRSDGVFVLEERSSSLLRLLVGIANTDKLFQSE